MAQYDGRCEACGRELDETPFNPARIPVTFNPNPDEPKNFVERSLKEHNRLLETLTSQLGELLELAKQGQGNTDSALPLLEELRQNLRPRHGLCIDGNCAPCRVHEEAIKEHVLLYIDWKIPGTVAQLQQARRRN